MKAESGYCVSEVRFSPLVHRFPEFQLGLMKNGHWNHRLCFARMSEKISSADRPAALPSCTNRTRRPISLSCWGLSSRLAVSSKVRIKSCARLARSLAQRKRGRPKGASRLVGWQAAVIVRAITDRTPDQLKMPFVLWTREAVRDLIAAKFQVRVSRMTMGRWLKRWGFTPQKPVRRAWEQNRKAVQRWRKETYPGIRRQAKREGAEIHWGDEMGMRSDHQAGRSYGRRGQTPVIPGAGQRFGCNLISTVTNRGTLRFMVFHGRFSAPVLLAFLHRLIRSARRTVYVILDRHPVHRSVTVQKWLARRTAHIRLFWLPPYSSELNPDENLNNDVKANAVGRRRPTDRRDMMADVRGYLRSTQKQPHIVKQYFHAPTVQYAMD